jgi:hypothetical protein
MSNGETNKRAPLISVSPLRLIVRLLLLSLVVGIALNAMDLSPMAFFTSLYRDAEALVRFLVQKLGLGVVEPVLRWIIVGAGVVVPIWLVATALRYIRGRR